MILLRPFKCRIFYDYINLLFIDLFIYHLLIFQYHLIISLEVHYSDFIKVRNT